MLVGVLGEGGGAYLDGGEVWGWGWEESECVTRMYRV